MSFVVSKLCSSPRHVIIACVAPMYLLSVFSSSVFSVVLHQSNPVGSCIIDPQLNFDEHNLSVHLTHLVLQLMYRKINVQEIVLLVDVLFAM